MRTLMVALLLTAVTLSYAADRVVLFEDFTNCGCGYCWNLEPELNAFVNDHLAAGDLAVIRVHVNWPYSADPIYQANPTEQNARRTFYGVNAVPWLQFDGVIKAASSAGGMASAFNSRIAVPSSIDIFVARNGDDQTGTVSIGVVAEEELSTTAPIRVFAVIVEDQVPGVSYWAGSYFEQAYRKNLFGLSPPLVEFTGPYPDTLYFEADYDITAWVADNLHLAAFVQEYSSSDKEVLNARWYKFMDLETGIEETGHSVLSPQLSVGPNPSSGAVSVTPSMPDGAEGTVTIFDVSGRLVGEAPAQSGVEQNFSLTMPGIYIVRLATGSGGSAAATVAVVR